MSTPSHPLVARLVQGDTRALARVCRLVDDAIGDYRTVLKQLFPHTGRAWTIGITGVPGAGKSTLTDKLIAALRATGRKVAVAAIDPTSPFSGGAILGDRIRMQQHFSDPGVFIRSLATRGALGGLSRSATDVVRAMDAWGADAILIETVGVGQDELEVTTTADTTLVVMAPGMGDDVQAIKAGILECADVFAVNKADRQGADATVRDLELMIALGQSTRGPRPAAGHMGHVGHLGAEGGCGGKAQCGAKHHKGSCGAAPDERRRRSRTPSGLGPRGEWIPPIVRAIATRGEGVDELLAALEEHRGWLNESEAGKARKLDRLREAMRNQLRNTLVEHAEQLMADAIEESVHEVARREIDPYSAAEALVNRFAERRRGDEA